MDTVIAWLNARRKAITALVTGLVGWAIAYNIADEQWIQLVVVVAVGLGVYAVPNKDS